MRPRNENGVREARRSCARCRIPDGPDDFYYISAFVSHRTIRNSYFGYCLSQLIIQELMKNACH